MKPHRSDRSLSYQGLPDNRRRHPRFKPRNVGSLLGEVLDMSLSGMRVFHKGPLLVEMHEEIDILIQHGENDLMLPVRVVRIEPAGHRRHAIGLEFINPTPHMRESILALHPDAEQPEVPGPRCWRMG